MRRAGLLQGFHKSRPGRPVGGPDSYGIKVRHIRRVRPRIKSLREATMGDGVRGGRVTAKWGYAQRGMVESGDARSSQKIDEIVYR